MRTTTLRFEPGFRVAFDVRQVQAAEMVIESRVGTHLGADCWARAGPCAIASPRSERNAASVRWWSAILFMPTPLMGLPSANR